MRTQRMTVIAPTLLCSLVICAVSSCASSSGGTGGTGGSAHAPTTTTSSTARVSGTFDEVVALARKGAADLSSEATSTGVLVYLRQGGQETSLAVGAADNTSRRALKADDTVMVASLTKTMVATVVLRLVAQGKLALSDTADRWLPGVLKHGSEINLAQMLSMTSGLPGYDDDPKYPGAGRLPAVALLRLVADQDLQFAPGAAGQESNTNFVALGLIAEKASGRPLTQLLQEAVIAPAKLSSTSLGGTPTARGYDGTEDATVVAPRYPSAAAGVVSSVRDVGHFLDALLAGRLVPAAVVADMQKERTQLEGEPYGLALRIRSDLPCGTVVGQVGGNAGYAIRAWRVASLDRTVVVAVTRGSAETSAAQLADNLVCG